MLAEEPGEFDPRKYLKPAMDAMQKLCKQRLQEFNTAGQASKIKRCRDTGRHGQALCQGGAESEGRVTAQSLSGSSTRRAGRLVAAFVALGPAVMAIMLTVAQWLIRAAGTGRFDRNFRGIGEPIAVIGFYAYAFGGILFLAGGIVVALASAVRGAPLTMSQAATASVLILGAAWVAAMLLAPNKFAPGALLAFGTFALQLAVAFAASLTICARLTRRWQ